MTGAEHYKEAERWLNVSHGHTDTGAAADETIARLAAAQAQVHATLALAAATAWHIGTGAGQDFVHYRDQGGEVRSGQVGYGQEVPAGVEVIGSVL